MTPVKLFAARAEEAGGLDQLPGLEGAALEVRLDRRSGVVHLEPLHRFPPSEAERRVWFLFEAGRRS